MIPQLSDCKPGVKPLHYNILVAVDVLEEKTAGGIIIPDKHKERENSASERGRIIDVSPMAFQGGDWDAVDSKPDKGEVILFQRYAGSKLEGDDGKEYRLIADNDIKGVVI